jgi:hypothetical protein
MAFAIADIQTRITNELAKLDDFSSFHDELIKDALTDLLTALVDFVRYSASLAVTTATATYDVPATIDIIERIEDADGDPVVYSVDKYEGEITFQDTPESAQDYTVYGTPKDIRTNAAAVIAALPESYYRALWAYVKAACHDNAESDSAEIMYQKAERSAHELLVYLNSEPGFRDRQISIVDAEGNRIGVSDPHDGVDNDVTDMGSVERYE